MAKREQVVAEECNQHRKQKRKYGLLHRPTQHTNSLWMKFVVTPSKLENCESKQQSYNVQNVQTFRSNDGRRKMKALQGDTVLWEEAATENEWILSNL